MTRKVYQVIKHGRVVDRIDNLGPGFSIPHSEVAYMNRYTLPALLHISEKNLLWHVAKSVDGDIANLGHAKGGSAATMGAALKFMNKPYTVHSMDIRPRQVSKLQKLLDNVEVYNGSTDQLGEQWAKEGRQFAFTFIDAGHDYEPVKADWKLYSPMSNMVGFHDTNQIYTDNVINEEVLSSGQWELIHHVITVKVFKRI